MKTQWGNVSPSRFCFFLIAILRVKKFISSTIPFYACNGTLDLLYIYWNTNTFILLLLDIDECTAQVNPCDAVANSECKNTDGSYNCQCKNGFVKNGPNCEGATEFLWLAIFPFFFSVDEREEFIRSCNSSDWFRQRAKFSHPAAHGRWNCRVV